MKKRQGPLCLEPYPAQPPPLRDGCAGRGPPLTYGWGPLARAKDSRSSS